MCIQGTSSAGNLSTTTAKKGKPPPSFPFPQIISSQTEHPPTPSIDVVESDDIPASILGLAREKRSKLIEQLAEVDDEIGEIFLNDTLPTNAQLAAAVRRATVGLKFNGGSGSLQFCFSYSLVFPSFMPVF